MTNVSKLASFGRVLVLNASALLLCICGDRDSPHGVLTCQHSAMLLHIDDKRQGNKWAPNVFRRLGMGGD